MSCATTGWTDCASAVDTAAQSLPEPRCGNSSVQCGKRHCLLSSLEWDQDALNDWQIIHAAAHGDVDKIRDAIQAGADVDATRSLTMRASQTFRPHRQRLEDEYAEAEIIELSDAGVFTKRYPNRVGNLTPLMHAAREGNDKAVVVLIEAGASVNLCDQDGMRPLHFAAQAGCIDCCAVLVAAGADTLALDDLGRDALSYVPADCSMLRAEREAWERLLRHRNTGSPTDAGGSGSCHGDGDATAASTTDGGWDEGGEQIGWYADLDSDISTAGTGGAPQAETVSISQKADRCIAAYLRDFRVDMSSRGESTRSGSIAEAPWERAVERLNLGPALRPVAGDVEGRTQSRSQSRSSSKENTDFGPDALNSIAHWPKRFNVAV